MVHGCGSLRAPAREIAAVHTPTAAQPEPRGTHRGCDRVPQHWLVIQHNVRTAEGKVSLVHVRARSSHEQAESSLVHLPVMATVGSFILVLCGGCARGSFLYNR